MALQDTWNKIKAVGLDVAESLTPVLKQSKFRETGVLTPEEFVIAGDHLVLTCPTWSWQSGKTIKKFVKIRKYEWDLLSKNAVIK